MIDKTLIVLDIETVKDIDLLTEDWPEDKWPPPIGWKVVAAGILIAQLDNTSGGMSIKIQDAQCVQGEEADLLNRFWSYFNNIAPLSTPLKCLATFSQGTNGQTISTVTPRTGTVI